MKTIISACLLLFTMNLSAQELNKKIKDPSRGQDILLNVCTREGLVSFADYKPNYDVNYANYRPDSADVAALPAVASGKKITIVLGTWCGDSKFQVPNFLKVLDAAKINSNDVRIICVDGQKHAENGLLDKLKIERVPTFIFTDQDGKEVGRITEHPKETLEADMLALLQKKQ